MAQVFAQAVECLVRERDSQFLQRIAVDYSLNLEELQAKYLAVAEAAIKVPRKYKKREAKEVKTTDEAGQATKCQGITAKKEPCKFSALKGGCFCKRHLEKAEGTAPTGVFVPQVAAPVQEVKAAPPAEETEKRLAAILKLAESEAEEEDESDCDEDEVERKYEYGAHDRSEGEEEYEDEE
jgi:hypothetical protein